MLVYAVYYEGKLVSVLSEPPSDPSYTVVAYDVQSDEEMNYVLKPVLDSLGIVRAVAPPKVVWSRKGKPISEGKCMIEKWSEPIEIVFPTLNASEVAQKYLGLPPSAKKFSAPLIKAETLYEDGTEKDYYVPAHLHGYGKLDGERLAEILDEDTKKVKRIRAEMGDCSLSYSRPDPIVSLEFDGECFSYSFTRRSPYPAVFSGSVEVLSLVNGKMVKTENCPPKGFELAVARFKPSFVADSEYLAVLAVPNPPVVKSWSYSGGKLTLSLTCSCRVKATVAVMEYEDVAQLESGFFTVKPAVKSVEEVEAEAENGLLVLDVQPPVRIFLTTEDGIPIIPQKSLPSLASALRQEVGKIAEKLFGSDNDTAVLALALYAPVLQRVLGISLPPDLMEKVVQYAPIAVLSEPVQVKVDGSPSLIEFDAGDSWAVLEFFVADDLNKKYAHTSLRVKGRGYFRAKDFLVASSSGDRTAWEVLNPLGNFALSENETDRHKEYVEAFTGIPDLEPTRTVVRCGNCTLSADVEEWEEWIPQRIAEEYLLNGADLGFERKFEGEKTAQGLVSSVFLNVAPGLRRVGNISRDDYLKGEKAVEGSYSSLFSNPQTSWVGRGRDLIKVPALYSDYLIATRSKGTVAFLTPKSVRYSVLGLTPLGIPVPIEVDVEELGYVPALPSIQLLSYSGGKIEVEVLAQDDLVKRKPEVRWILKAIYPFQSYEKRMAVGELESLKLALALPDWFKYGDVCIEFWDGMLSFRAC